MRGPPRGRRGVTAGLFAPKKGKVISESRMAHMHGVAEWMYEHAAEFGCTNREEVYFLGLVHDIGYMYKNGAHEAKGAEFLERENYDGWNTVLWDGADPNDYTRFHSCFPSEVPKELVLLWAADMMVDHEGKAVGITERLEGIKTRYGEDSSQYRKAKARAEWLKAYTPVKKIKR